MNVTEPTSRQDVAQSMRQHLKDTKYENRRKLNKTYN